VASSSYKLCPGWRPLAKCVALCSRAEFERDQFRFQVLDRKVNGDASEAALLKFAEVSVGEILEYRDKNKKLAEIPFNSTNKYQVSIHEIENQSRALLVMKGAPETVLEMCSTIFTGGRELPLTDEHKREINQVIVTLGGLGERVLGFCDLHLSYNDYIFKYLFEKEEENFPIRNLRFLGLISLIDPPR
jgi:sodium/potassium-transporting ATPase subunit alpha